MPDSGYLGLLDFDGGAYDRTVPPTREHLEAVLRRVSGADISITELRHASTFTDRAMQATAYRRERILLAGDAAHIHSPLGGQGLNLGLGDAVNLGWKLAATVKGHAPDALLDTYARERRPVGASVLDWSRAQVAVMRPDPHTQAAQAVLRDLIATGDGATLMYERTSGASIRYDLGDGHDLVGRTVPLLRTAGGGDLAGLFADGRGVLLDFTPDERLRAAASAWPDRIGYAAVTPEDAYGTGALLVRPDGVVAWTGDPGSPDPEALRLAAGTWFGAPMEAAA